MSKHHKVLRFPLITERNTMLRADNKYVFEVDRRATKKDVREAVQKLFDVSVESVNTMIVKGKRKRMGRFQGYRPDRKKAIVKLAEGSSIEKFGEV
ncbi:MAG: 50S ribosomal protein L23 [Chitinivibrionales bacterium]|nr:50S ribosomal protein L23 [Chitinivibrionales bacterium]